MTRRGEIRPERLRLEVLGRISLRRGAEEIGPVLTQPKRFALLTHIALRRPGSFVRRDELLGAFWAESSESRGRAALRQALRFLRHHLGPDVVVNRGVVEVGLGSDALTCDALEFLQALDRQEDGAAVERYGGDLLPGFLLEDAWEFDRWLHAERQRLRVAAVEAALRLARRAEEEGSVTAVIERMRWAHRLEPTDEAVARRLISHLARAGNRGAALSVYEKLASRLSDAFDLEPSPETVQLFEYVRDGEGGAEDHGRDTSVRPLSPQRVLVLELENLTGDGSLAAVGRLAADTLAQGLATLPDLEVVPPIALGVAPPMEAAASAAEEREHVVEWRGLSAPLTELARRTGAGTVVGGAFHLEGDALSLRVRITDVAGDRLLKAPGPVRTRRSAPMEGVERLREGVMTVLGPALSRRPVHVRKAAPPPGIEGYRAYLDGLERFIGREWRGALEHFRRSVALEPDYALPRIVSSIALWNLGELEEARATAMVADDLRHSLGPFEHAVLDMVLAWLRGDWAEARRAALRQTAIAPGSIPHFQVAEEARRLNRPREAREVLGRLDPESGELEGWIFYWIELATAHHLVGDHRRELEVASRCRRLHPDDPAARLLEIRALAALGREADVVRTTEQALSHPWTREPLPGELMVEAGLELRAHGSGEAAAELLGRAVEWYRARSDGRADASSRRALGRALYHADRLQECRAVFEGLAERPVGRVPGIGFHHAHLQAHLDEGYLAVIAVREGNDRDATRWCTYLQDLERPFLYGAQWYWLAAVASLRDDPDRAVRMLRRAFRDGLSMEMFLHADPHLLRLRGHAGLDALLRPSA